MQPRRPLFGGYALVALVGAWVAGIALRPVGPLAALTVFTWLLLAGLCAAVWLVAGVALRLATAGAPGRWWRLALVIGMLGCLLALGAARATAADGSASLLSVARLATGRTVTLQGTVAAEPDLRDGYRIICPLPCAHTSGYVYAGGRRPSAQSPLSTSPPTRQLRPAAFRLK